MRLVLFLLVAQLIAFQGYSQRMYDEKEIEVAMRLVGHSVLLSSGDTTSLVLPIEKDGDVFKIQFENPFSIYPEDIVNSATEALKDAGLFNGYILEVEECESKEVVYSYRVGGLNKMDLIPCRTRELPESCYSLLLSISGESMQVQSDKDVLISSAVKKSDSSYSILAWMGLVILVLLLLILFVKRNRKEKITTGSIVIGKFIFDPKKTILMYEDRSVEMTGKEADLLMLLNEHLNQTVKREDILNVVWGDEGDYVGRTLDVFISKLRKKLESDPEVKIVNVRGVGYRLVV